MGILSLVLGAMLSTSARADKPKPAPVATAAGTAAQAPTPAPAGAPEKGLQGQPKAGAVAGTGSNVVKTEEGKEGVKTYQFGAVEVEGRLRSPQLIYFLRRVRAEFLAGDLGHRSFLPELSETARHAAFR
jgi:hypothetical protein